MIFLALLAAGLLGAPDPPKLPAVTVHGATFNLIRLPAGEFDIGSDAATESPRHHVRIRSFDLGQTEVTVALFRAFTDATGYRTDAEKEGWTWVCCTAKPLAATWRSRGYWERREGANWRNPGFPQTGNDPVVAISWQDAVEFCKWLSTETGRTYRLPSEAEWEYAARSGRTAESPADPDQAGWHRDNSGLKTHPVARKQPNAWGVYDMLGNAWEWVADVWAQDYTGAPADGSPRRDGGSPFQGLDAGEARPLRGGAWGLEREMFRYAGRPPFGLHQSCNNSGFRVARSLE